MINIFLEPFDLFDNFDDDYLVDTSKALIVSSPEMFPEKNPIRGMYKTT